MSDLIAELERLAAEATPPERWTVDRETVRIELADWLSAAAYAGTGINATLIVAAINALPRLLAVWRAAKYVAYSNGFDAALPDKIAALRSALSPLEQKEKTK